MRSQAVAAGLEMEPTNVMWKIDDLNKRVTNSIPIQWWPLELFPFKRLLYDNSDRRTSWCGCMSSFENNADHQQASFWGSTQDHAGTKGARVRAVQEQLQALRSILQHTRNVARAHVLERCGESSAASEPIGFMGKGHLRRMFHSDSVRSSQTRPAYQGGAGSSGFHVVLWWVHSS
jgi:hypothetical protein